MGRKSITLTIVLFLLAIFLAGRAWAEPKFDAGVIKAALHTTALEEEGFVDRVVKMTNEGKLPAELLERSFVWARGKPKHKFQYFKRALIVQAADMGIRL